MMINYQVVALFICCLSDDLINYYNPFQFLKKEFPDVKDNYIITLLESFRKDQMEYIVQYKKLLETEPNESIYKMLDVLEPVVQSYAYQMDHPGFTRGILFKFDKYFGEYK